MWSIIQVSGAASTWFSIFVPATLRNVFTLVLVGDDWTGVQKVVLGFAATLPWNKVAGATKGVEDALGCCIRTTCHREKGVNNGLGILRISL